MNNEERDFIAITQKTGIKARPVHTQTSGHSGLLPLRFGNFQSSSLDKNFLSEEEGLFKNE